MDKPRAAKPKAKRKKQIVFIVINYFILLKLFYFTDKSRPVNKRSLTSKPLTSNK